MTTSNTKFRTGSKEAPTEPFKRAVTACLRAIAKAPELEVTFAAERPGLSPGKARLPEPARKMNRRDAARSEEHTSELQSRSDLVCRLLLEKKKKKQLHHLPENKKKKKT